jgi:hypothetical protein
MRLKSWFLTLLLKNNLPWIILILHLYMIYKKTVKIVCQQIKCSTIKETTTELQKFSSLISILV